MAEFNFTFNYCYLESEDLLLEDEKPHTLSSTLKLFFRQLPKPVICGEFYDDFLRCTGNRCLLLFEN